MEVIAGPFWSASVGEHLATHLAQYIVAHLFGEEIIENGHIIGNEGFARL